MTISPAREGHIFLKFTADQVRFSIGCRAHVKLTCQKNGKDCSEAG